MLVYFGCFRYNWNKYNFDNFLSVFLHSFSNNGSNSVQEGPQGKGMYHKSESCLITLYQHKNLVISCIYINKTNVNTRI